MGARGKTSTRMCYSRLETLREVGPGEQRGQEGQSGKRPAHGGGPAEARDPEGRGVESHRRS